MPHHPRGLGLPKRLLRRESGLTTRSPTGPRSSGSDWNRPAAAAWRELRQNAAAQKRLGPGTRQTTPTQTVGGQWGGAHTPPARPMLAAQEAPQTSDRPPARERDALMPAVLAGPQQDPESSQPPALDHLPLATYQALSPPPSPARRAFWRPLGHPKPRCRGWKRTGRRNRFCHPRLRYGAVMADSARARLRPRPDLSYHSPDLPPTTATWANSISDAQVRRQPLV